MDKNPQKSPRRKFIKASDRIERMKKSGDHPKAKDVILLSFAVDLIDVILSFVVTALSGSIVMVSQVLEGVADLISSGLLVNLDVHLNDQLTTNQIEKLIDDIKKEVRKEVPSAKNIQVELETPE